MSSIDEGASVSGLDGSISRAITPPRRLPRNIARILGRFLLTGIFLALGAAVFPLAALYGFIWWAQH